MNDSERPSPMHIKSMNSQGLFVTGQEIGFADPETLKRCLGP
jgi:hypothetical protein